MSLGFDDSAAADFEAQNACHIESYSRGKQGIPSICKPSLPMMVSFPAVCLLGLRIEAIEHDRLENLNP
jgi:hypothetical protein